MRRPDAFIITIIALVFVLTGVYYIADHYLNYFENNKKLSEQLKRKQKVVGLMKKIESLDKASDDSIISRDVASISAAAKSREFEIDSNLDSEALARSFYDEAKLKCYEINQEIECLNAIDKVVTHFPDSKWSGESLLILSDYYYRTRRVEQAKEVVKILKYEFKNIKNIQDKVAIVERALQ